MVAVLNSCAMLDQNSATINSVNRKRRLMGRLPSNLVLFHLLVKFSTTVSSVWW